MYRPPRSVAIPPKPMAAEDIYIAQTAQGSDSGADAANAHSVDFFNSLANWTATKTPGKIGPGDTVYLVGNITSALTVQRSGADSAPITILFASGATMSVPTRMGSAIILVDKQYVIIDGGATGDIGGRFGLPELANGMIECTDNGTDLTYQNSSGGVSLQGCKHCIVRGLVSRNHYVRTRGGDQNDFGSCISVTDPLGHGCHDVRVENCIVHDAYIGVNTDYSAGDYNYEISKVTAFNCNWGVRNAGRSDSATLIGLMVHDCWLHDWSNWDDTISNNWHHNGLFIYADHGNCTDVSVYNNWVSGVLSRVYEGETSQANHSTSGFYINTHINNVLIYNNIFIADGSSPGNGLITLGPVTGDGDQHIYNNTFCLTGGTAINFGKGDCTYRIKNNIFTGGTAMFRSYATGSSLVSDHNIFFGLSASQPFSSGTDGNAHAKTFAQWQALGWDADSVVADPRLDPDTFAIGEGSPAIGAGADLSAFFATDAAGALRSTPWDIGAFRYGDAPETAAPAITAQPADQMVSVGADVTLSVVVSGVPTPALQWQKDGMDIAGATGATLVLAGVTLGDAGTYTCVATNSEGSATSDAAILTVNTPAIGIYRFAGLGLNPMLLLP